MKARNENMNFFSEQLKDTNILITGATGLIGSVLTEYLLELNERDNLKIQLFLLVRDETRLSSKILKALENGYVKIIKGDVCKLPDIEDNIDYIIHGASITVSRMMIEQPVEVVNTNIKGTNNLLNLALLKKVKSMVYLSTMEVYGFTEKEVLLTEDNMQYLNPLVLRSSYPESKRMAENLCVSYASEYDVPVKIVRLAQTLGYGVKEDDTRVFAEFARCAKEERNILLLTDGKSKRMYLDSVDAARAILTVLLRGNVGEAYNAANKATYCSIREMAEFVAREVAHGRIEVLFDESINKHTQFPPPHRLLLDVSKLEELGWRATAGLKEMYLRMLNSW